MRTNGYKRGAELSKSLDFVDPDVFRNLAMQDDTDYLETDPDDEADPGSGNQD